MNKDVELELQEIDRLIETATTEEELDRLQMRARLIYSKALREAVRLNKEALELLKK